jgi:hypothetical protein
MLGDAVSASVNDEASADEGGSATVMERAACGGARVLEIARSTLVHARVSALFPKYAGHPSL